jgi:hypothetical protein
MLLAFAASGAFLPLPPRDDFAEPDPVGGRRQRTTFG